MKHDKFQVDWNGLIASRARVAMFSNAMKLLRTLRFIIGLLLLIPTLYLGFLGLIIVWQFPFTSGVIAHAVALSGEEVCIVQTFKGLEPYQVSLFARQPGQKWVWSYLAHQDSRWRSCRIEFQGGRLLVYRGFTLNNTFSLARATDVANDVDPLPADYTPERILAYHNQLFQR